MSLFSALHLGTKSMAAQQQAMEVVGHNLSNVSTQGYSRQRVTFVTANPTTIYTPSGQYQVGTGVDIESIRRVHDDFLQAQIQAEEHDLGKYETLYENYKIVESAFNEPSDSGISNALTEFWQSWQRLATPNPGDHSLREEVKVKAVQLTDTIKETYSKLTELQEYLDNTIVQKVTEVNALISRIASINDQIANLPAAVQPNDLLDKRDQALNELARYVNYTANEQANGVVHLAIGGSPIVIDNKPMFLSTSASLTSGYHDIRDYGNINITDAISNGDFSSLVTLRDTIIEDYKGELDTLAATLINEVNALHATGYDLEGNQGIAFFTGSNAFSIDVHSSIQKNVNYIAASSLPNNTNGNGEIAEQMYGLQSKALFDNGTFTVTEFFQNVVSTLANDSGYAKNLLESQQVLVNSLGARKESLSGVSIDEEMASLLQYEQSYVAAGKYVSVINKVIDSLMSII